MNRPTIDFIIWSIILATIFTYAGWSRGRMEGFKAGYETGIQMPKTAPPTINIWE